MPGCFIKTVHRILLAEPPMYQQRGGVIQETHIGNQRVYPGQSVYPPASYNGVVQPGYVPSGTAAVYDPVTGRVIPVRRR